jgi:hypothetical protein
VHGWWWIAVAAVGIALLLANRDLWPLRRRTTAR